MRELVVGPFKSLVRVFAQVRKELIQVRRRPGAFFSLVLGPFLIMAIFGLGFTGVRRPLETVIVIPPDLSLPRDAAYYQELAGPAITIVGVTEDAAAAEAQLVAQELDLVVVAPADAAQSFRAGQHAEIQVQINSIDPVGAAYGTFIAQVLNQQINEEIIKEAVTEGQSYVLEQGGQVSQIPPEVIAQPTTVTVTNVAPSVPSVVGFAAPAALALMLQHMAVTLTALSFVRERLSGAMELFRISPVNSLELALGKYLGLGIVSVVIAAISTALLVGVLGVPMLGSAVMVAAVIGLIIFASLGIGLIISVVSDSERQAVQLALLLLLASVFFSGFVLPVSEFREGVQIAAYALPVTHGIQLLQEIMLRGEITSWWSLAVLGGLSIVFLFLTVLLVRRAMRNA
ncbi:MAG TPA: ABC transporter permease [Candidatus Limnocylindrales bacterium]|nr:ABC transporter permease [Candidatus Limnocylindrales bacterium]